MGDLTGRDTRVEAIVSVSNELHSKWVKAGKPKTGISGNMTCPMCSRTLRFMYAGPKALRAKCETVDCLSFVG